jgi:hypothetical protein
VTFAKPFHEAVDDLYAAFAAVPVPLGVPYCDHCVSDGEIRELLAWQDVRTLPATVLEPYARNLVVETAGSDDDARYFTPRLLEVSLNPAAWPDLVMVGRFLQRCMTDWPSKERAAVDGFARALWLHRLTTDPYGPGLPSEQVLCAVAYLTGLAPLLQLWTDQVGQRYPAAHLAELLQTARLEAGTWRLSNLWWDGRGWEVDAWLHTDRLLEAVEYEDAADRNQAARGATAQPVGDERASDDDMFVIASLLAAGRNGVDA